jgi:hypothetical protein
MPPLSPQPLDLRHFLDNNSTHIPPLLKIPYPDGIVRHTPILMWMTVSSWYFGSWESVYFDIFYKDSTLQRFKIVIKPDLSDVSLHFICMSEITSNDLMDYVVVDGVCNAYMIYEDALVYCWNDHKGWGAYAGLTSAPFTNIVTRWNGHTDSICPTSGRFVNYAKKRRVDGSLQPCRIDIADLF